jgi:FKBP-type peptidyl-prolyl cis-trans isomerase
MRHLTSVSNRLHSSLLPLMLLTCGIGGGSAFSAMAAKSADVDPTTAAATYFGSGLRSTFNSLRDAGVELNEKQFLKVLQQAFQGKNTGITPDAAEAQIRAVMAPSSSSSSPTMAAADTLNAATETAWVASTAASLSGSVATLQGGTILQTITEGTGATPSPLQTAVVAYTARLSSGKVFDSTADEPDGTYALPLQHVVPGLADAMLHMHVGGTYRVLIPPGRAYGAEAIMDLVPANAALDWTIELRAVR